jgi:alpha-L-fucosidase
MITKVVSRRKITALLNRGESLKTTKKRRRKTTEDRIDPSHHTFRFEGSRALKSILEVVSDEIKVMKNAMPHTTVIPPRNRGSFSIDKLPMSRVLL